MNDERKRWLDEPRNVNRLFGALCVVCALLVAAELFVHKHAHFSFEEIPGFYVALGFVAFFLIVLAGRALRRVLQRDEDYYDRD